MCAKCECVSALCASNANLLSSVQKRMNGTADPRCLLDSVETLPCVAQPIEIVAVEEVLFGKVPGVIERECVRVRYWACM